MTDSSHVTGRCKDKTDLILIGSLILSGFDFNWIPELVWFSLQLVGKLRTVIHVLNATSVLHVNGAKQHRPVIVKWTC